MLSVVGIVLIVVFSVQTYKGARDTGRNAVVWTLAAVFTSIFLMIAVPICVGVAIGIYLLMTGVDPENFTMPFGLAAIAEIGLFAVTVIVLYFIQKQASKIRDDVHVQAPPPPTFGGY